MVWNIPENLKERVSYTLSTFTLPVYQEGVNHSLSGTLRGGIVSLLWTDDRPCFSGGCGSEGYGHAFLRCRRFQVCLSGIQNH